MLPPHELEVLAPGEVLLDGVVRALDQHRVEPDPLLQVRHRRRQAERVDRPAHAAKKECDTDTVLDGYQDSYIGVLTRILTTLTLVCIRRG